MRSSDVRVDLTITSVAGEVHATLSYANSGSTDQYVEKSNGCLEGEVENDVFKISTEDGVEVPYIGRLEKREAPGPGDFVRLRPTDRISVTVGITSAYEFVGGKHQYSARYSAFHGRPDGPAVALLESNVVHFTLVGFRPLVTKNPE